MVVDSRVTLQTIADRLGVSRTTVSNAYNRPDQLGSELRDRVLAVAATLGYAGPNAAGRMLRTGRMGAIGLLFTDDLRFVFTDPNTTSFVHGVAETSALAGTGLTLLPVPVGAAIADTAVPTAAVDGYLVFSVADDHPALGAIRHRGVPVVVVDEPDLGDESSFVGVDDRAGAASAAEHLLGLGHHRLGVVLARLTADVRYGAVDAHRLEQATVRIARARMDGYRDAMSAAGLDPDSLVVWESGENAPDAGQRAVQDLLALHPDVTVLLCFSDQLAIGAITAAGRMGRTVPADLSIVGFDDIPRARGVDPALTTVRQPLVDKGRVAAEILLGQITDGARRRIELPIELVVRASSGPPIDYDGASTGL